MDVTALSIPDVKLLTLRRYEDERGYFIERFNARALADVGIDIHVAQDNHAHTLPNVLRGFHFQTDKAQGKLVSCLRGRIFDVAVDLRWDSEHFGKHTAIELAADHPQLLWVPAGFGHAVLAMGDEAAEILYKTDQIYNPASEGTIAWNDTELAVD